MLTNFLRGAFRKRKEKMIEFPEQPSEAEVREKLREMYRTLLSGRDQDFFKVQSWVFQLSESDWINLYTQNLQDDILGCVDQYRLESRCPASDSYPGPDWPYPFFLAGS
jgi:hypothetical protein